MGNNNLIPANSKKSLLIFGFFTWKDLIIFGSGATITMFMLLIFNSTSITQILPFRKLPTVNRKLKKFSRLRTVNVFKIYQE